MPAVGATEQIVWGVEKFCDFCRLLIVHIHIGVLCD